MSSITLKTLEQRIKALEYASLATNDLLGELFNSLLTKKVISQTELVALLEFQLALLVTPDGEPDAVVELAQSNLRELLARFQVSEV